MKKIYAVLLIAMFLAMVGCGGGSSGGDDSSASTTYTYYKDADGDGYSDGTSQSATLAPTNYYLESSLTSISGDCDDSDPDINPGASEICDGLDNDCDPSSVDGAGDTAPLNAMQDGVCVDSTQSCAGGSWQDDYTVITDYESTESVCDGLDNDCDSSLDESCTTGDCVGCHSSPQDDGNGTPAVGRRAAAAEFPAADAHAHYGATLGIEDCFICHDESTHGDGNVDLLDPDGGTAYSFVLPADLASDPDLSDFCMACHDADGATRLASPANPFGDGNTPSDVKSRFAGTLQWNEWYGDSCFVNEGTLRGVNSHHDISDADQAFSGGKIECLDCHNVHTASATQPLVDPFSKTSPWLGGSNDFCIVCHAGGTPADPGLPAGVLPPAILIRPIDSCDYMGTPWWTDYTWTHSTHGPNSKRDWENYSSAPGAELPCLSCHESHGSWTPTNTAGNPYMIRDVVDGTPYVDDGVRNAAQWTGPPWETFGTAKQVVVGITGVDVGWSELCVTCHSSWLSAYVWHESCGSCQTCHGHGRDYGETDWGGGVNEASGCNTCGNGVIDGLEECDDDNQIDGDGCSNECTTEY